MVVPPDAAAFAVLGPLEEAIAGRQKELHAARAALSAFTEIYTETRRQEEPPLTLLTGGELINRSLAAAVAACRTELLTAQPGGGRPPHALGEALERDLRLLGRGVRQQTIYQHTVRSHQATMSYIEQITDAGAEVRTLSEVFERMIICDRRVAFIPVSEERSVAALQVRHPALVRLLAQFFDNAWARSIPVHADSPSMRSSPTVTSDVQRAILLAVVSGETDDSIARRLGMSRRSVAEHIRKVSQRLGSSSRAQLGYLLATSGLLDPDGPAETGT
ncbi:LuxR C-terminal-related transcriptional regulator [Streptomyces sp. NBC_00390]|uniref:LuxR C-terminal-related transcriptional regulator n=1 Tax=Streptomyces sp. NBC_00390 TaxID=2975736 RepID=UPI002E1EC1AA